ncbi:uncharacterized protein LOC112594912 [Melanaphis sacchari]|uniref:uncharacterized protein LOC112594912 n=1 Tax=Melanaphis sacchari TaxID=742174 RepID=UPI000DC12D07|nr:uncharacterized protein LOC112594912 [Melanaphis sacchari]
MKETSTAAVASKSGKRDVEMVADGISDTADRRKSTSGCRRRIVASAAVASSHGGQSRTAMTVLSMVMVACAVAAVDLQHVAIVCQHWLLAMFQSAADQQCALTLPDFFEDVLRPPIDCSYCQELDAIEKVFNLSAENFEKHYAYTGRPVVVVEDSNVERSTNFGFRFFKNLSDSKLLTPCQFFPYKTEFKTLEEALNMDDERAKMTPGYTPWYIGWSNCERKSINRLKEHITLPNFLPKLSDRKQTLWIFMGTPGHGAPMHIDKVAFPSWQTQISGYKKWTLRTPAECFFKCKRMFEVFMEPGSTIVLDTNIWYHETQTIGQDISITVGGEYD